MPSDITIHYSGGLQWWEHGWREQRFEGEPACTRGDKARRIIAGGNLTDRIDQVTCKHCRKLYDKVTARMRTGST